MFHVKLVFDLKGVCLLYGFILCQVRLVQLETQGDILLWSGLRVSVGAIFSFSLLPWKQRASYPVSPLRSGSLSHRRRPTVDIYNKISAKRLIFLLKFCRTGLIHAFTQCWGVLWMCSCRKCISERTICSCSCWELVDSVFLMHPWPAKQRVMHGRASVVRVYKIMFFC